MSTLPNANKSNAGVAEFDAYIQRNRDGPLKDAGVKDQYTSAEGQYQVPAVAPDSRDTLVELQGLIAGRDVAGLERYLPGPQYKDLREKLIKATMLTMTDNMGMLTSYARDKAIQEQENEFNEWATTLFDTRDPAQLQIYNELFPDVLAQKEAVIDRAYEVDKRMHKINLRGAKTKEDLRLIYLVERGDVTGASQMSWVNDVLKPAHPKVNDYKPGRFNPMRGNLPTPYTDGMIKQKPFSRTTKGSLYETAAEARKNLAVIQQKPT